MTPDSPTPDWQTDTGPSDARRHGTHRGGTDPPSARPPMTYTATGRSAGSGRGAGRVSAGETRAGLGPRGGAHRGPPAGRFRQARPGRGGERSARRRRTRPARHPRDRPARHKNITTGPDGEPRCLPNRTRVGAGAMGNPARPVHQRPGRSPDRRDRGACPGAEPAGASPAGAADFDARVVKETFAGLAADAPLARSTLNLHLFISSPENGPCSRMGDGHRCARGSSPRCPAWCTFWTAPAYSAAYLALLGR